MNKYKTIKFNLLLILSFAKDFDQQISWEELYDNLYIKNTDIYKVNVLTLKKWNIEIKDLISQKQIEKIIKENIVVFQEFEDDEQKIVINTQNNESFKLSKKITIQTFLSRLGYTQKIK